MFSFCFIELKMGNPLPIDRPPPVVPLMFGCTANDPPIHHFSMPLLFSIRMSVWFLVPLIYFIIWTNLSQSSFSGSLTLVVSNEIVVHVSGMARLLANNIFTAR